MKIKRFVAPDMRQAMQRVREEQGPDAVILSTRRIDSGIEIVAALDYDEALVREAATQLRVPAPRAEGERVDAPPAPAAVARVAAAPATAAARAPRPALDRDVADDVVELSTARAPAAPIPLPARAPPAVAERPVRNQAASLHAAAASAPNGPIPRAPQAPVQAAAPVRARFFAADESGVSASESRAIAAAMVGPKAVPAPRVAAPVAPIAPALAASVPQTDQPGLLGVQKELNQLRQMLEAQVSSLAWNDLGRRQPQRARVLRDLTRYGIESDVAAEIVEKLPAELTDDQSRYLPLGLLSRRVVVNRDELIDAPSVVALVGPTGVGKTTTIAKLAARFVLRRGRGQLALISTDDFRIGAEDQLLHYGRLLGVPVYTASDAKELSALLARLGDKHLVLIDTPGMNARDARLGQTVATLRDCGREIRTTLVLGANAQGAALDEIARAYAALKPAGAILTKLDEAPTLGGALSVAIRHRLPLDYVADGQRVPEDLVVADAHRLVVRLAKPTAAHGAPDELDLADRFGRAAIAQA